MTIEVKVPVLPESVTDATIAEWHKKAGDAVQRDENLVDLETDKVMLEVPSPTDGVLKEIRHDTGDTVNSEDVIAVLEEGAAEPGSGDGEPEKQTEAGPGTGDRGPEKQTAAESGTGGRGPEKQTEAGPGTGDRGPEKQTEAGPGTGDQEPEKQTEAGPGTGGRGPEKQTVAESGTGDQEPEKQAEAGPTGDRGPEKAAADNLSPAARRFADEEKIDVSQVQGTGRGGQITKEDLVHYTKKNPPTSRPSPESRVPGPAPAGSRPEERVPMTRIRIKIAERLMQSKNSIAMLTSSNEVNLSKVVAMRKQLGERFRDTHGIKLGYMSFFVKAASEALKRHPVVNASVDGTDIIYHGYQDISIAVSTERGLVTPVLRDAQDMSFAEIEKAIAEFADKARKGRLALADLQGGTFTVTNGGTFGSLFSTPIVNPPQSAILGMHTIKERAVVVEGEVMAAPMMYIAISYDHRIVDGKDAVLFLVDIKDQLENPDRMLLGI